MAKKQIEIIKKIEAEARIKKPKVLNSKRSAFLNKQDYVEGLDDNLPQRNITSSPEGIVTPSPAEHCWGFSSIYASGAWHTPSLPWHPNQPGSVNHNYGPWGVYGLPGVPGPPPSPQSPWFNAFANDPVFRQAASNAFHDFVVSNVGPISIGDTVILEIQDPNQYMACSSFGVSGGVTVAKYCLKYEGIQTDWTHTWCHYGLSNQVGHDHAINCPVSPGDCSCTTPSGECYDIGDIGPEGGIIFSVPGVGPNTSTNMYYEVAQNDIVTGGTPNAGFNLTCGSPLVSTQTPVMVSAGIYSGTNGISFSWGPGNLQWIGGVQVPWNQSFNYIDYTGWEVSGVDDNGNQLWAPGTTITSSSYPQLLPTSIPPHTFLSSTSTPSLGTLTNSLSSIITFTPPATTTPWSATGAEWGVHNKPNIATSTDFGTGHINTDAIDAYPLSPGNPTGGIHPWLGTHDIAATLCKQHGFTNDWFLPSRDEFTEMFTNVGPQLGLNPLGQNSEHMYWTSSHKFLQDPVWPLPHPDKYAWVVKSNGVPGLAYRCHAFSVRPIRRFECEPEPLEPCPSPPDCNFEYNYRDGYSNVDGGFNLGGGLINPNTYSGYTGDPSAIHWNTTNEGCTPGTPPVTITTDSTIGSEHCTIYLNRHDVLGNVFSDADFNNHTGYTISAWDTKYNFMGKWKYSNLFSLISTSSYFSYDRPQMGANGNLVLIKLRNVQHLEGDYPVVYYAGKPDIPNSMGSHTAIFLKVEWDGNAGNYETGCNSTTFGNPHPYYSPGSGAGLESGKDWPYYCGPLYGPNGATGMNTSIPRYATFPPLDAAGNTLTVYPDLYTANPYYTGSTFPWNFPFGQAGSCDTPPVVIQNHCFSVCAVRLGGLGWYAVPDPWFGSEPYGPIAMENNPLGTTPPPFSSNPPVDQDYTDFYDWIITQIPTPVPGDSFIYEQPGYLMQFAVTDPNTGQVYTSTSVDAICFKYRGIQTYNIPLNMINDGYPTPNIIDYYCCRSSGPGSLMIPAEDDPRSIKLKVNAKTPTKRQRFIGNKQPKNTGPFGIFGYYPLYDNIDDAIKNSPDSSYHIHEFGGKEYYMPNGLGGPGSGLQFHGDWEPKKPIINIENFEVEDGIDPEEQITQPEQQRITPPPVVIPEPEETYIPPPTPPPPSSTPTYTPPPSTSSGESEGGGY